MTPHLRPPRPLLPGVRAIRAWRATGRRDAVAGLAVAAYLVPQCLAYGRLAGVPPVAGLWAALAALVVYALLGTSSRLSVGPESASALLVGLSVSTIGAGMRAEDRAALAAALALAVAAIALAAWALRLGFLADLLSRPVLVGYLAGVAVAMVASQLPNLTGIASPERSTVARTVDIARRLDELEPAPLLVGALVVAALVLLARIPRAPGPLLVVLAATAATAMLDLEDHAVVTIGEVPGGLPAIVLPGLPGGVWPAVLAAAAGISVVVVADNVLTARAFAAAAGDRIDTNQEILALAGANAAAGAVGGFPVSSSASRTAIVAITGGQSQLVSLVAAAAVAAVLLVAGPLIATLPLAALGGLVVYAAVKLVDLGELRRLAAFRLDEAVIAAAAFAGVLVFDVLAGIGIAVALSVFDLFARIARAHDAVLGSVPGLAGLHDVDDFPDAVTIPGLVIYRYDAPLCFANAEVFRTKVLAAVEEASDPVEWVLLNMEANVEVDVTATDMLEDLRRELRGRGIELAMARVKHDLAVRLARAGLIDRIGADRLYPTLPTAIDGFRNREGREGSAPG